MRVFALGLVLLAGCTLYPFGGDDDEVCDAIALSLPEPERKVNPSTLTCEEFAAPISCNADCGPCPLAGTGGAATYIPPWGRCESACTKLGEQACMDASECRVAREHDAYYRSQPSFEGCYEKTFTIDSDPFAAECSTLDAEQCAMSSRCTGLYELNDGALPAQAPRGAFRACIDEAQIAGSCHGTVACRAVPPACPASTTPGVANGCWTGSCIPDVLCGV